MNKRPTCLSLDQSLIKKLDLWRERQDFPPSRTKTIEQAIRLFLDKETQK